MGSKTRIIMVSWRNVGEQKLYTYDVGRRTVENYLSNYADSWCDVRTVINSTGVYTKNNITVSRSKMSPKKVDALRDEIVGLDEVDA